jgi:hypothetical protein
MENKNQSLIEIIDNILRKIENPPPNSNTISIRPSEIFSFKDKHAGYEEMYSFFENLKKKGVIKDFQCVDSLYRIFYLKISDIDKEKLIKEREKLSGEKLIKEKITFPYDLPEGAKWEHLRLQFIDGYTIKIEFHAFKIRHKESYDRMGFLDRKRMMPNKQWEFLKELANNYGRLDWGSEWASFKIKKQKSLLSKTLKEYFKNQISGDPFFLYRKEKCYQTRFQLFPEEYQEKKEYEKYFSKEELEEIKKQKEIEEVYKKEKERGGKKRSYLEEF